MTAPTDFDEADPIAGGEVPHPGKLAYTLAEAAILLGTSESLLTNAVTARRIQHRRLGKQDRIVRFTREDLLRFLDANVVEAQQ